MEKVSIEQCCDYELVNIRERLTKLLEPLGGLSAFIEPGERVLIKPNMLAAKHPDLAVTTHPTLVQVICEMVVTLGAVAVVGDSPGYGNYVKIVDQCGFRDATIKGGGEIVPFTEPVTLSGKGLFKSIDIAKEYFEADKIINVPKLKTHEMMLMTCAVKNLFGSVVGMEKAAWHLKAGKSRELFAGLMLEIYQLKKPVLNIVDAIWAMEGNGPAGGTPVYRGLLLAGENAVSVDVVSAHVAGIDKAECHIERAAIAAGIYGSDISQVAIVGKELKDIKPLRFKLPDGMDAKFGLPVWLSDSLKKYLMTYPVADKGKCILCGVCRDACPPVAISIEKSALSVDNALCIRCWCCRELCPYDAMTTRDGWLLRVLKRLKLITG